MKKLFMLILCLMAATGLIAAAHAEEPVEILENVTMKTVCERVFDITYTNYDFDAGAEILMKYAPEMGGCSAVRVLLNGKVYVGRNYDYYCSNAPAFIVRVNNGKNRIIGLCNNPLKYPDWSENYEMTDLLIQAMPYSCCDILSEAGLYAETNVRMYEEELVCNSTNPGASRRCTQTFMVTMLSQYDTIDEILAHVDDYDWFDLAKLGFEQSFMITDQSGRSVVVEFGANSWSYTETFFNANYYFNSDLYAIEKYPCGEMRISKELSYLPYVRTPEDIFTMMEQASYGQFYTAEVDPEYAMPEFAEEVGYNALDPSTHDEALEKTKELTKKYSTYTWEQMVKERCWESTFITVANVTDLTLDVHFSEHYGIEFKAGFEN